MSQTMKAIVFKGPHKIALEDRLIPKIIDETDALVKVSYTALCGSELHVFRGHQPSDTGFIMGHEFTGTVVEVGKGVTGFKAGDKVVSSFTTSCLECFYCKNGYTSRCTQSMLYGSVKLDGGQAEYVRVPLADGTLFQAPPEIPEETVILMADIFPTGYFAASNGLSQLTPTQCENAIVVLIGCGPVGLCALIAATSFNPARIFAIDSVPSRLELAKSLGAEPLNFMEDKEGVKKRILEATDGRGADVVLEVVGNSPALRMGFDVVRPWGVISSVGVHNAEIPFTGNEAYNKNVRIQFGRCPVRAVFPEALELLKKKSHLLGFMADKIMPITQAEEGYELFDKMKVQKVIFRADQ
ncbi:GroES-like protein [Choiromyces venosus 120613-1]|uniref:GroES-like protein n=1 Tax=Choiromyces venosus 120613-1 TaxID=1336337 RepID=A0A3N4JCU0_9PEZI|nr:GroES-like protein [Choiromyces venosus 120613-1]